MSVCDKDTAEGVFAIIGDPGKLTAVIIQKTGCQTDSLACGYICKTFGVCIIIIAAKAIRPGETSYGIQKIRRILIYKNG